jgi:transmembrane sensor
MNEEKATELLKKYENGTISADEKALLETWYLQQAKNSKDQLSPEQLDESVGYLKAQLPVKLGKERSIWSRIAAAASILVILSAGGYFLIRKPLPQQIAQNKPHEILPGTNQATLTLANGQKIALTKSLSGKLAQQGNTTINMTSGGEITYTQKDAAHPQVTEVAYNTLTTKRKEQFPLVLADGTKVWLNSSSAITYPVTFNGKERRVSITGEAYFEVVHNAAQPFRVTVSGQTVEDIGTEFNINAYDDEPAIKTTLITGSARVTKGSHKAILKPGQATITKLRQDDILVEDADVEEASAWKNGQTLFDDEDIQSIMRQVSRWYDVDVVYEGKIPNRRFAGGISRKSNLSSLLKVLEANKIHCTVENQKIIIKP